MGKVATYNTDIIAGADEQAAMLRGVAHQAPLDENFDTNHAIATLTPKGHLA